MKKILKFLGSLLGVVVLVAIIIFIGIGIYVSVDVVSPDEFVYVVNSDKTTCTITGAEDMDAYSIDIPEEIDGYTVTKIAAWAFKGHKCTTVFFPETIEYIGAGAFAYCEDLSGVFYLEKCTNLKEIQAQTFRDCYCLDEISLPEGLEKIGEYAFYKCYKNLTDINIPSTVTTIEYGAFTSCQELTKITIPASVELIGVNLFEACISLESIEVEVENANYRSIDGVLYTKGMKILCAYPSNKAGEEYTIPDGVTTIATGAFAYPQHLKTLNIPDSIEVIDENAFIDIYMLSLLNTINYNGTVRMWKNIYINPNWNANYHPNFTIYCKNGRISKDGTVTYY